MQARFRVDALDVGVCGAGADVKLLGNALLRPAQRVQRKHFHLAIGEQELLAHLFGIVSHGGLADIGYGVALVKAHQPHQPHPVFGVGLRVAALVRCFILIDAFDGHSPRALQGAGATGAHRCRIHASAAFAVAACVVFQNRKSFNVRLRPRQLLLQALHAAYVQIVALIGFHLGDLEELAERNLRGDDHAGAHDGIDEQVVRGKRLHVYQRHACDGAAAEPHDPAAQGVVIRVAPAEAHKCDDDVPGERYQQRIERGGEHRADVRHIGEGRIQHQCGAREQLQEDEHAHGHDALALAHHQGNDDDADGYGEQAICNPGGGLERDGRTVGVAAQEAVHDGEHADARCRRREEALARQQRGGESEEVVVGRERLDIVRQLVLARAQHAGELQEGESGGNVEAVGADERANVNLHLADGKGAEHIQHGGGAAASACAAQPIEDGERCEERDGRA